MSTAIEKKNRVIKEFFSKFKFEVKILVRTESAKMAELSLTYKGPSTHGEEFGNE